MSPVLCVHPASEDLRFLDRVIFALKTHLGADFCFLPLHNNNHSHEMALEALAATKATIVVFLCHGTDTCIRGSDTARLSRYDPTPFDYPQFINRNNCSVLARKHVFCFSCYSNGFAATAISGGATAFLGFKRIRFNYEQDGGHHVMHPRRFEAEVKAQIAGMLIDVLVPALTRRMPLIEMARRVRAASRQRALAFVKQNARNKHRHELARILWEIGDGVSVTGFAGVAW